VIVDNGGGGSDRGGAAMVFTRNGSKQKMYKTQQAKKYFT